MAERNIDSAFWTHPQVRRLSADARYLFLYLVTNKHTHVSGIYELPVGTMVTETGMDDARVRAALSQLETGPVEPWTTLIRYDFETESVWVVSMLKRQARSPKVMAGIPRHLNSLHCKGLITEMLEYYKNSHPIDRVSIPLIAVASSNSVSDPDPETVAIRPQSEARRVTGVAVDYLNEKTGRRVEVTDGRVTSIKRILSEGKTEKDVKVVIWSKCCGPLKWLGDAKMDQHLNLETILRPSHFQKYLEQARAEFAESNPEQAKVLGWV